MCCIRSNKSNILICHTIFIQSDSHNNWLKHKKKPDNLKIETTKITIFDVRIHITWSTLWRDVPTCQRYFCGRAGMMDGRQAITTNTNIYRSINQKCKLSEKRQKLMADLNLVTIGSHISYSSSHKDIMACEWFSILCFKNCSSVFQ